MQKEQKKIKDINIKDQKYDNKNKKTYDEDQSPIGCAMGFFLSFIGLIIGVTVYPKNTNSRKTFIEGWWNGSKPIILLLIIYLFLCINF